jgi:hypothetical protein
MLPACVQEVHVPNFLAGAAVAPAHLSHPLVAVTESDWICAMSRTELISHSLNRKVPPWFLSMHMSSHVVYFKTQGMNVYAVVLASRSENWRKEMLTLVLRWRRHTKFGTESCLIRYPQVCGNISFIIFSVCFLLHGMVEWLACLLYVWKVPCSIHGPEASCVDVALQQVTAACF